MSDNAITLPSDYFPFRPDLRIEEGEVVLVSNCRNELQRLPYFLDYYRRLGVSRFLIIDNNSDDGTADYLKAQPDVEYFFTDASYRGALSGRLWTQELADTYAIDRWVLTVDADELLVYPGIESVALPELCAYLDDGGIRGLFAFMLDMYADVPLSEAVYEPGTSFLDTCAWFEVDSYHLSPGQFPPFIKVEGGPRSSLYDTQPGLKGPESTKVPLIRWQRGFSYIASTHSHRYVPLADITGTLLHFKFFSMWKSVALRDAHRGDQIGFYDKYAEEYGKSDPVYWRPESIEYRNAAQLVELGVIRTTERFAEWIAASRAKADVEHSPGSETLEPHALAGAPRLDLRAFSQVWGLFNNPQVAAYYGVDDRVTLDSRKVFLHRLVTQVALIDAKPDHLLLDLRHAVLHIGRDSGLELVLFADAREIASIRLEGSVPGVRVDTTGLHPNTYRWDLDLAELAGNADVELSLYLRDATVPGRVEGEILEEDRLLHSRPWSASGSPIDPERVTGGVEAIVDGRLIGWVFDHDTIQFRVPVTVWVNGRLVTYALPRDPRPDLKRVLPPGVRRRPVGFSLPLPLGFFESEGPVDLVIEVGVAGSNSLLPQSPIVLPPGVRSIWWDSESASWSTERPSEPIEGAGVGERVSRRGRLRNRLSGRRRR